MGQKVNPVGMRIGINRDWNSKWFASKKDYGNFLIEDVKIRAFLEKDLKKSMLSHVVIGRVKSADGYNVNVKIYVARPGDVLGQDGSNLARIRKELSKIIKDGKLNLEVVEVKNPDLDAVLVAKWVASELEKCRLPFHDEKSHPAHAQSGCPWMQDPLLWPSRRSRNRSRRGLQRGRRSSTHHPRRHRFRPRPRCYHLW